MKVVRFGRIDDDARAREPREHRVPCREVPARRRGLVGAAGAHREISDVDSSQCRAIDAADAHGVGEHFERRVLARVDDRRLRAALLEAAVEVIAEEGVAGATHRSIAARAGMSTSTTSYFFSSLDDLIAAALEVVGDRIVARVEAVTASVASAQAQLSPQQAIDRFVLRR